MAKVIMTKRDNCGDYQEEIIYKAEGEEAFAQKMCEKFLNEYGNKSGIAIHGAAVKVADMPEPAPGLKEDVVAIYDDVGIPSFMYRITKKRNCELFPGGSDKVHPAFIIGNKEYDEIYISVYENCNINGKPYSLPMQKPWTNITNDEAARVCFSKGEGWHLMTRAEWGLVSGICGMSGILPHGNTNYGQYYADGDEEGIIYEGGGIVLTGSGPETWTHNHKKDGIHDLCGNVWEMVRGFRIKNSVLQAANNNDAALDIDLTAEGDDWRNVVDDRGKPIHVNVADGEITFTTDDDFSQGYAGVRWRNVSIACASEQLGELGLWDGEENAYLYVDSTDGEYVPICGGCWISASNAGVFCVDLNYSRTDSYSRLGFRSAYYRKLND